MALSASALATELEQLTPTDNEATAAHRLAVAWETYFYGASVSGVPAAGGSLSSATAAMETALVGMSAAGSGAAKLQAGITAFWATLAPLVASIWVVPGFVATPPATPPPGLAGLTAALGTALASNAAGSLSLSASAAAVAAVLHASGGLGGICILQPTGPGAPVPTPIL